MTLPIDDRLKKKIEDQKKKDELKQKHLEEYRKFRIALSAMCKDANGQIVLRHLCTRLCAFWKSPIVLKGGDGVMDGVDSQGSLINMARQDVYRDLRKAMSPQDRRLIESQEGEESHVENV